MEACFKLQQHKKQKYFSPLIIGNIAPVPLPAPLVVRTSVIFSIYTFWPLRTPDLIRMYSVTTLLIPGSLGFFLLSQELLCKVYSYCIVQFTGCILYTLFYCTIYRVYSLLYCTSYIEQCTGCTVYGIVQREYI